MTLDTYFTLVQIDYIIIIILDFGFMLGIAPGGAKFERSPFKLTTEMVQVMGGMDSQYFRRFRSLCVRAFLAIRPYSSQICHLVSAMANAGLPCLKNPESALRDLRDRFYLGLSDSGAAVQMQRLVTWASQSISTTIYDQFQKYTNGIPY